MDQTKKDIDIYVIDNASTDDSVQKLVQKYGDKITVVVNKENLGGSGGFNTGLRIALEKSYKYAMLVDNDVIIAPESVEKLYRYIDNHPDVGILGSEIYQMAQPDKIQDFGGSVYKWGMRGNYYGKQREKLPDELEPDYLCTCTIIARVDAIKQFGLMPEDNFIYWDDVEWCVKCKNSGYKVKCISGAPVHHNLSSNLQSAFVMYYMIRNKLNFFAKYISDDEISEFVEDTLTEFSKKWLGYYSKNNISLFKTQFYAFNDFLNLVRGKADDYKIRTLNEVEIPFEKIIKGKEKIRIKLPAVVEETEYFKALFNTISKIADKCSCDKIWLSVKDNNHSIDYFLKKINDIHQERNADFDLPSFVVDDLENEFDLNLVICEHVKNAKQNILPDVYVDKYYNCITSDEDYQFFKSMDMNERIFKWMYTPIMKEAVYKIRAKNS